MEGKMEIERMTCPWKTGNIVRSPPPASRKGSLFSQSSGGSLRLTT